jgi:hypothetical protein
MFSISPASRDASMPDVIVFDVIQTLFYCVIWSCVALF